MVILKIYWIFIDTLVSDVPQMDTVRLLLAVSIDSAWIQKQGLDVLLDVLLDVNMDEIWTKLP